MNNREILHLLTSERPSKLRGVTVSMKTRTKDMANPWSEHLSPNGIGSFRTICVSAASKAAARKSLGSLGFKTYHLDSSTIKCKESLLTSLANCIGVASNNDHAWSLWDATSDAIWQALMEKTDRRVAILFNCEGLIAANQPQLFLDGLEMMCALGIGDRFSGPGQAPVLAGVGHVRGAGCESWRRWWRCSSSCARCARG